MDSDEFHYHGEQLIDGVVFGSGTRKEDLINIRDDLQYFEDDIIVATYPKAGMTWMGLLPDTLSWGLRMHRECRERFPRLRGLAITTCVTAGSWRTCYDACRDR